jgi:hypothetical protein
MRRQTVVVRNELFVATAILAAHASALEDGFRQRDVKFFSELFSNWAEPNQESELAVQNVQIQRYLVSLQKEGYLKAFKKGARPSYKLSRVGLLELLTRLVESKKVREPTHFFFLVFFIKGYRERLAELVRREGEQFPPAMRIELEAILDVRTLVEREIKSVDRQLAKLESRCEDAHRTSSLVGERLKRHVPFEEVVAEVEKKMPYELNSRRPLSELISSIQPDQRRWELLEGNRLRSFAIWEPTQCILREYRAQIKALLQG